METMVIATLEKYATDPWVTSKTDYGWTVDRGPKKRYVRWGDKVIPFDRILGYGESNCLNWQFAYTLRKDGQQFYVLSGQELPTYEKVELLTMSNDRSHYAFAGYRQGQWHACYNGREIAAADDICAIEVSPGGNRVAFLMKKGPCVFIQEKEQAGPMFEYIEHNYDIGDIKFSKGGQFIAYQGWRDGQIHFVLNHETQFSVPEDNHYIDYEFSLQGNRWICICGEESGPNAAATVIADGKVLCRTAENDVEKWWSHRYFSPDEVSLAFPFKTESGASALWHDGKQYNASGASAARLIGWLPDNIPGWLSCEEEAGWFFHAGNDAGTPAHIKHLCIAHIGSSGNYACVGTPLSLEEDYSQILVKDGVILMQAQNIYIQVEHNTAFAFEKHLFISYWKENSHQFSYAIDGITLEGFKFHGLSWSPDGERFICQGEQNEHSFLIVDSQSYGPFDEIRSAVFSDDSRHWCGVVKEKNKWLVLLDGDVIDQLDHFDRGDHRYGSWIPFHLFTEDNRWCHYYGIDGTQVVYRRVAL